MSLTTDRTDSCLNEILPDGQQKCYLVLSDAERAKGFVAPVRTSYRHKSCGSTTTMGRALAETWARDPLFYGATMCCQCHTHRAVSEFVWADGGEQLGSGPECTIYLDTTPYTVPCGSMQGYQIAGLAKAWSRELYALEGGKEKSIGEGERITLTEGLQFRTGERIEYPC